jgi:hypothetical protein
MNRPPAGAENANTLLLALGTILVVSFVGGNVLMNCTTRYNVSANQVRAWKEALYSAESGADIAYNEVRKTLLDPTNAFSGWTKVGATWTGPATTFGARDLTTSSTVDLFYHDPVTGNPWYRIRTKGTAPVEGLRRVGMDDRMNLTTRGDSLLRKIDFNFDHFIAAYGPNGDGVGKANTPVPRPQIARRLELIAAPITPFEAAIKASGNFYGLGSAAQIDSYNSKNGSYYFAANNPADPFFSDARSGSVQIGTAVATIMGMLYGNVATNGGTVIRSNYITGTIDNNVPFTLPPFKLPTDFPLPQSSPTQIIGNVTINPPAAGSPTNPNFYLVSSFSGGLTINRFGSSETYVALHVTNDITGKVTIKTGVHAQIFFDGNLKMKARDMENETNLPGNLQFYAISPPPGITQTIDLDPPGDFAATFYAPSADFTMNGNPDILGAIVCRTFYGNGNTSWHYDRALDTLGDAVDYRISSYVEDIR